MTIEEQTTSVKKKFKCHHCGATRIWLHNWAVKNGDCDGKMIDDWQRGYNFYSLYRPKYIQRDLFQPLPEPPKE